MCIAVTADFDLFETVAGAEGIISARLAIDRIAKWSESPSARHACLHVAQAYKGMSRRMVADGTSFLPEMTLFNAALVLGLYVYVSPAPLQSGSQSSVRATPFDLLMLLTGTKLETQAFLVQVLRSRGQNLQPSNS